MPKLARLDRRDILPTVYKQLCDPDLQAGFDIICTAPRFFIDFPEKPTFVHGGAERRRGAGGESGEEYRAAATEEVCRLGGKTQPTYSRESKSSICFPETF